MPIFRGRWRQFVLHLLGKEDPPEKVAAAFALGVAIGFSPLVGGHTLIALGLALLLGLPKVDVVLGTLVVNPWTMVPIYTLEHYIGRKLLRYSPTLTPKLPWRKILQHDFWSTLRGRGWHDFRAWSIGAVVLGGIAAAVTFYLVRGVIRRYERSHPHLSARMRRTARACPPKESGTDVPASGRTEAPPRPRSPEATLPPEDRSEPTPASPREPKR